MDYHKSLEILGLKKTFTYKELKKQYYLKSLKYHPDKNIDNKDIATIKFKEISDAYNYLIEYTVDDKEITYVNNINYLDLIQDFLILLLDPNKDPNNDPNGEFNKEVHNFISLLNYKSSSITKELFKKFSKNTLVKINNFLESYSNILHINKELLEKIKSYINNYINIEKIKLTSTIENLLNDDIYKLEYKEEYYYIPLWHNELVYEMSNNTLIIECEYELPESIDIDEKNNIYITLNTTIKNIINNNEIVISLCNKKYIIPVKNLYIKKYQRYSIIGKGISIINTKDIYNIDKRANIYIDIWFQDIE